ncbi:transcription factor Zn, C2H2 [Pochonia chlamydosporia 170]|uniref:Transcription factor Zn, C2H2 n=1 Tax=Pochonia chlamydosporia 170 TaxID=1380566 RepID=A0A179GA29_METCM|nr:transcription factor Zn, C2H2 [Pochonia chlamydosporia 170]OAQ74271.1 transcription factor Zn, C2H2 [Pochonia chlamydosporia 170]
MADVRSLLRQQKAARRIDHPYAAYSDAGKLLCTLCREQLKAESQWDGHLLSQGHKQKLQQKNLTKPNSASSNTDDTTTNNALHKRKLHPTDEDDDQDVEMGDAIRRKRSKPDIPPLTGIAFNGTPAAAAAAAAAASQDKDAARSGSTNTPDQVTSAGSNNSKESTRTPPSLMRRLSTTPSQGIELQIPSRPATPAHREGGSSSSASGGYFAIQSQAGGPLTPLQPSRHTSAARTTSQASTASNALAAATADKPSAAAPVDESEWAAFEAEIAAAEAPYDEGAVISAPAMTTEEAAAKDAENADRKTQVDVDIEDEKEEATRALEDEFAEMKELEARVKNLKEKREEFLKKRRESQGQENVLNKASLAGAGKQNGVEEVVIEDDEDDDEEEEDDWDGFRFRT